MRHRWTCRLEEDWNGLQFLVLKTCLLIRRLFYGFLFGGLETSAGPRFDSHLTGVKKGEFLLAHENNSTSQRLSMEVKSNAPC